MKLVMRKNQSTLSDDEKQHFVDAVLALKKTPPYKYDNQYVLEHYQYQLYGHSGPAFLPWHRQFLIKFEQDLQEVMNDPLLSLPYWDWSVDREKTSSIWVYPDPNPDKKESFMGGDGRPSDDKVMDGPFAYDKGNWDLNVRIPRQPDYLQRRLGRRNEGLKLPTQTDVTTTLNETPYDVVPWNSTSPSGFRNRLEGWVPYGMHNLVHVWVGGSMGPMNSPNDPVFFLHHCFIDKLWVDWQVRHPNEQAYLPTAGAAWGHNLDDMMPPWTVRPRDMLDHRLLGYRYDTEDYLWKDEELAPYPTQWLSSPNGRFSLRFLGTAYGLYLFDTQTKTAVWELSNQGNQPPAGKCIMQKNGNLVIYAPDGNTVMWASGTAGNDDGYLEVHDGGYVAIYRGDGSGPIWRRPPPAIG